MRSRRLHEVQGDSMRSREDSVFSHEVRCSRGPGTPEVQATQGSKAIQGTQGS